MTIVEIKKNAEKNGNFNNRTSNYNLNLYVPFFDKNIRIFFYNIKNENNQEDWLLTEEIIKSILSLTEKHKIWLQENSYQDFLISAEKTEYGMVEYNSKIGYKKCNIDHFQIYNKEDAYNKLNPSLIIFELDYKKNYFLLEFDCPWEEEHGFKVKFERGGDLKLFN